jgi:hypothetical protein
MADKIKFKLNPDGFNTFLDNLNKLSDIGVDARMKIDKENILIYSILGDRVVLAFKNFMFNTSDLFEFDDLDFELDMIVPNVKKFVKNLELIKDLNKVNLSMDYRESRDNESVYLVRYLQITCGRFKINWVGGDHNNQPINMTKEILKRNLDIEKRLWSFNLTEEDFEDIKKLSKINSEKIINISVDKGKVLFSEKSAWDLGVDKIDNSISKNLILNKRFLKCIDDPDKGVEFSIFENFMLIKEENSNLMLSFEQDFNDEDF